MRALDLLTAILAVNGRATLAIWLPIKDLATYDGFLGDVEDAAAGHAVLAVEIRLRPLTDPMRLNGCAVIVVNPPPGLEIPARAAAEWIATKIGEDGALGRVTMVSGGA